VLYPHANITITNNIVYSILTAELMLREQSEELCYFQFQLILLSKNQTFDEMIEYYKIIINNTYTAPVLYVDFSMYFSMCKWISDSESAFNSYKPSEVFAKVMNVVVKGIDRSDIGIIPSSICKCTNFTNYNCSVHDLGQIFPG